MLSCLDNVNAQAVIEFSSIISTSYESTVYEAIRNLCGDGGGVCCLYLCTLHPVCIWLVMNELGGWEDKSIQ